MKDFETGRKHWLRSLILVAGLAAPAAAQAPRITPAGDPSVKSDTIYKLAVNPSDYADQPYIYLLDDGVVRFEADGRGSRTYRQVIQVFTREAAESWGEQSFSYSSDREKLTVNWVRVLKPDGEIISSKPAHEQESIAPVAQESPVYSDVKVHRVSLGGVAPNTLVDYSYTVETLKPIMPGDIETGWRVTAGRFVRRSRLILDVPTSMKPVIRERNLSFERTEKVTGTHHVYTWATKDVARNEPEPFAADSNGLDQQIDVTAPLTWSQVAAWYAGLAKDRYTVTPAIDAKLKELLAGAKTAEDSLRAAHRWVAQDFRYVSLSLGIGGFQPRNPASVFETKYGDCKDKATFFIALAKRMGFTAYPVLLNAAGAADSTMVTGRQFDHMIAAVERPGGYLYLDLTAELTPYGTLPPSEQGSFALVVHPDGRGEEVTLPEDPISSNRQATLVEGELDKDGSFEGRYVKTASGTRQYGLRSAMASSPQLSSTEREKATRAIANSVFEGASGDSLQLFDGRDLKATPRLSLNIRSSKVVSDVGDTKILQLPLDSYSVPALIADLEARPTRRYPIDVSEVFGTYEDVGEFKVTLPEGWRAKIPEDVDERSAFGRYQAQYSQEGRLLTVRRSMTGSKGIQPPDAIGNLITWLRAVSKDDARFIVLERR